MFGCSKSNDPAEEPTNPDYDDYYLSFEAEVGPVDRSLASLLRLPYYSLGQVLYSIRTLLRFDGIGPPDIAGSAQPLHVWHV